MNGRTQIPTAKIHTIWHSHLTKIPNWGQHQSKAILNGFLAKIPGIHICWNPFRIAPILRFLIPED
jgi:hypothetical protein